VFWLFSILNLLIVLICLYETFMVSSNRSLLGPAIVMAVILAVAGWLRPRHPRAALAMAGLPAGLLLLYVLGLAFQSDWR